MSNVRIELNSAGIDELLHSPELEQLLKEKAEDIAAACGAGYGADTKSMKTRVIASVYTEDEEAMRDNLESNTILRNLK